VIQAGKALMAMGCRFCCRGADGGSNGAAALCMPPVEAGGAQARSATDTPGS